MLTGRCVLEGELAMWKEESLGIKALEKAAEREREESKGICKPSSMHRKCFLCLRESSWPRA